MSDCMWAEILAFLLSDLIIILSVQNMDIVKTSSSSSLMSYYHHQRPCHPVGPFKVDPGVRPQYISSRIGFASSAVYLMFIMRLMMFIMRLILGLGQVQSLGAPPGVPWCQRVLEKIATILINYKLTGVVFFFAPNQKIQKTKYVFICPINTTALESSPNFDIGTLSPPLLQFFLHFEPRGIVDTLG